ncbi:MAG: CBS domain-containing protein [Alkalibacterium sp.]|nr:CBS domain-containing protein [Alkalibacterium sp.]
MENNYQRFMHAFNELHNVIAHKINKDPDTNFGELLGLAAKQKDKVIETYISRINFYRELRNILTHKTLDGGEAVAQPSEALIHEIELITEKIQYNKKVKDLFLKRVRTFDVTDRLDQVLDIINRVRYTQFPVFDGTELVGIVTSIGVTKFLAKSKNQEMKTIMSTTIEDILGVEDDQDFYAVIPSDKSIFDIEEIFLRQMKDGHFAFTLLIARENEIKSKKDLAGIITPWDIPRVVANK